MAALVFPPMASTATATMTMQPSESERSADVYSWFPTAREGLVPMPFYHHHHHHHLLHLQHLQHQQHYQLQHNHPQYAGVDVGNNFVHSYPQVYHQQANCYPVQPPIMSNTMPQSEDMEHFQKLSNEYEPDLQGPLVGLRQSSEALSQEYAQADPVYVAKTAALAQTHSHYRIMKGDGNCGWRAVAYGYFENLFALRDQSKVAQELMRIKSFNKLFESIGQQEHLYEIFVDATEELLASISEQIGNNNQDETFLLQAFNDEFNSNAIITHFRLMTSAWMRLNRERYEAFLSVPLDQYCASTVDTVRTEIDEIGLQALVDGVIEASGFAVQIYYLDRSFGDQVNEHQLTSSMNPLLGTIKLLYRPGHYDLLYGSDSLPAAVNCQYSMTCNYSPWNPNSLIFRLNPVLMSVPSISHEDETDDPAPTQAEYYHYPCPANTTVSMAPQPSPVAIPVREPEPVRPAANLPVRPPPAENKPPELLIRMNPLVDPDMTCLPLTIPFRNSHFNQAHFLNSKFQPSQWDPSEIYKKEKKTSNSRSRTSSSSE